MPAGRLAVLLAAAAVACADDGAGTPTDTHAEDAEMGAARACFAKEARRIAKLTRLQEQPVPKQAFTGSGVDRFGEGSFGRCAMVGNGPSLSGQGLGAEIDQKHDTVIRFTKPQSDSGSDYGGRLDVLVRRTCDFGVDEYEHFKDFFASHNQAIEFSTREANASTTKPKAYLTSHRYCGKEFGYKPVNHADPFNHSDGVPIMYWDGLNIRKRTCKTSVLESRFKDCAALHHHNPTKPTSGFSAAIFVFISGLCTSLDLYGYSTTGTAKTKYWEFAHATSYGREAKPFVYKYGTEEMMKLGTSRTALT